MPKTNPYETAARTLLKENGVRVKRYLNRSKGSAYTDGSGIECPKPRGPVSFAILAHEVGHCVLHVGRPRSKPRWQEEVEAWDYALDQFGNFKLQGKATAIDMATNCIGYAFGKALRRGAKSSAMKKAHPYWWARCRKYKTITIMFESVDRDDD